MNDMPIISCRGVGRGPVCGSRPASGAPALGSLSAFRRRTTCFCLGKSESITVATHKPGAPQIDVWEWERRRARTNLGGSLSTSDDERWVPAEKMKKCVSRGCTNGHHDHDTSVAIRRTSDPLEPSSGTRAPFHDWYEWYLG